MLRLSSLQRACGVCVMSTGTNVARVQKGLEGKCTNAMLLKVNQIGSITESLEAWALCR